MGIESFVPRGFEMVSSYLQLTAGVTVEDIGMLFSLTKLSKVTERDLEADTTICVLVC